MTQETNDVVRELRNSGWISQNTGEESDAPYRAADLIQSQSARIAELREALEAIDKTTFIGVTTDSEQARRVALESAHDIAHDALTNGETNG